MGNGREVKTKPMASKSSRSKKKSEVFQSVNPSVSQSLRRSVSPSELAEKRRSVRHITQNLEATYGIPINDNPYDPLSELVLTILSQATTDTNSRRAFESLRRRFPDWESARRARPSSIAARSEEHTLNSSH